MSKSLFTEVAEISRRCLPFMAVGIMFAGLAYQYGQGTIIQGGEGSDRFITVCSVMIP